MNNLLQFCIASDYQNRSINLEKLNSELRFENTLLHNILDDLIKNKVITTDDFIVLKQKHQLILERSGFK